MGRIMEGEENHIVIVLWVRCLPKGNLGLVLRVERCGALSVVMLVSSRLKTLLSTT